MYKGICFIYVCVWLCWICLLITHMKRKHIFTHCGTTLVCSIRITSRTGRYSCPHGFSRSQSAFGEGCTTVPDGQRQQTARIADFTVRRRSNAWCSRHHSPPVTHQSHPPSPKCKHIQQSQCYTTHTHARSGSRVVTEPSRSRARATTWWWAYAQKRDTTHRTPATKPAWICTHLASEYRTP